MVEELAAKRSQGMANHCTVTHDICSARLAKHFARKAASPQGVEQKRMTCASYDSATHVFAGTGRRGPPRPRPEDGSGFDVMPTSPGPCPHADRSAVSPFFDSIVSTNPTSAKVV